MSWLIGQATVGTLRNEHREEMRTWLRSLGQDPDRVLSVTVSEAEDGGEVVACFTRFPGPKPELHRCCGELKTEHVAVPLEQGGWPTWLAGYGHHPALTG